MTTNKPNKTVMMMNAFLNAEKIKNRKEKD